MPELLDVKEMARDNFEEAASNLDKDLAAAKTPEQARAIRANHEKALAIYMGCLRKGLSEADGAWKALLKAAQTAKDEIIAAREAAEGIADRIKKLGALTEAVSKLVKAAA